MYIEAADKSRIQLEVDVRRVLEVQVVGSSSSSRERESTQLILGWLPSIGLQPIQVRINLNIKFFIHSLIISM